MATWRNAARYCWFKVNLFIPAQYINLQQSSRHRELVSKERDSYIPLKT